MAQTLRTPHRSVLLVSRLDVQGEAIAGQKSIKMTAESGLAPAVVADDGKESTLANRQEHVGEHTRTLPPHRWP